MNQEVLRERLRENLSNKMADLMLQTKLIKLDTPADMREQGKKFIKSHNNLLDDIMKDIEALIASKVDETAKAYGGCTDCYGKGYATVNDRWTGHGTDGDIGGFESRVSGGNPNAMKFCKCERGKQLAGQCQRNQGGKK